jgi:predicted nucleic acid-binding Zn ribbon protein
MREREKLDKECRNCGSAIPNRNVYCDNVCQWEDRKKKKREKLLKEGVESITKLEHSQRRILKAYLINKHGEKCMEFNKYTNKVPIQIDHIDGDPHNQKLDNIRLLCPNCHSLTEFFGRRGKGRKDRYSEE